MHNLHNQEQVVYTQHNTNSSVITKEYIITLPYCCTRPLVVIQIKIQSIYIIYLLVYYYYEYCDYLL